MPKKKKRRKKSLVGSTPGFMFQFILIIFRRMGISKTAARKTLGEIDFTNVQLFVQGSIL